MEREGEGRKKKRERGKNDVSYHVSLLLYRQDKRKIILLNHPARAQVAQ